MNLHDEIEKTFRTTEGQKKALKRLELSKLKDLLFYLPRDYSDTSNLRLIRDISTGDTITLYGKVSGLKTKKSFRTKIPMAEGVLEDETGKIKLIWFNQAYIAKMLKPGQMITVTGKVSSSKGGLQMTNPEVNENVQELCACDYDN